MKPCRLGPRAGLWLLLGAIANLLHSPAARAQPSEGERGGIVVGAFITDHETDARLDSSEGSGSDIDLEEELGFDNSISVVRLNGLYWFNDRHRVDLGYFDLSRDAASRINETLIFGDLTLPAGAVIESTWDLVIVKADYTFAVVERDRGFLGVMGGLYVAETQLELREAALGSAETSEVTAPLPVFGLHGDYAITNRITLRGTAQIFGIETHQVKGRFRDLYVGADYAFSPRVAVGLAYNDVSLNVKTDDDRLLSLDWMYDGLVLYVKVDF